jgi:two-component system OmpR family response regulator
MRILLVEDDAMLGGAVETALKDAVYAVDWVQDGEAAVEAAACVDYALALLDLGLPKRDGLSVLKHFRVARRPLPVIIVTAQDAVEDRIAGLDLGADDYLVKPFEVQELLARMRAVLRRQGSGASAILRNGAVSLDPAPRVATVRDVPVHLNAREFSLLRAFLSRPGVIMSRSEIEDRIYGWNEGVESNSVEFHINSLRKKLGPAVIRNIRGMGWMVERTSLVPFGLACSLRLPRL